MVRSNRKPKRKAKVKSSSVGNAKLVTPCSACPIRKTKRQAGEIISGIVLIEQPIKRRAYHAAWRWRSLDMVGVVYEISEISVEFVSIDGYSPRKESNYTA